MIVAGETLSVATVPTVNVTGTVMALPPPAVRIVMLPLYVPAARVAALMLTVRGTGVPAVVVPAVGLTDSQLLAELAWATKLIPEAVLVTWRFCGAGAGPPVG